MAHVPLRFKVPSLQFEGLRSSRVHAEGVALCERASLCLLSTFYDMPPLLRTLLCLAHQKNRTIAIASDFRVDGAKSPEILQKEGISASEIATRNRKQLATFHRTLFFAMQSLGDRAF